MAINLPGNSPVTDEEWNYLVRIFSFKRSEGLREVFNKGLDEGLGFKEQIRYRGLVRQQIRSDALHSNPYFELEFIRAAQENRSIGLDQERYRRLLWNAYYAPKDEVSNRKELREQWRSVMGREDHPGEFLFGDT